MVQDMCFHFVGNLQPRKDLLRAVVSNLSSHIGSVCTLGQYRVARAGPSWEHAFVDRLVLLFCCGCYFTKSSANSLCCRGSGGVSSVLSIPRPPYVCPSIREFVCAGTVNINGHVPPVYAKMVTRTTFVRGRI